MEDELRSEQEVLGEPEPQETVELETAALLRMAHSNDWKRAEVNARINRALLEREKKPEEEVTKGIKTHADAMATCLKAIAEIDALYPEAKASAREILDVQRKARERQKAGKLVRCPRCEFEFAET